MSSSAGALGPSTIGSDQTAGPGNAWHWRLEDRDGNEVTGAAGTGQSFPSQSDAESWVGEVWRDLLDDGVDAVRLFEGDREVYGPMSLHSAG
ncbi:MAG: hypothetical protein ACXVXA_18865 [Nocardioidaceae bacterium]